jgi:hypothetical protein
MFGDHDGDFDIISAFVISAERYAFPRSRPDRKAQGTALFWMHVGRELDTGSTLWQGAGVSLDLRDGTPQGG